MAAITICSNFGAPKNKVSHCFPIYLPWSDGTRCHVFVFWMLSFKPTFSLSSFISPSNLDSSLCFFQPSVSYDVSAYKLNKQVDNIQPWRFFSRRYSQPRDWIWVSCIAGRSFTIWATGIEVFWLLWLILSLEIS